MHKSDVLTPTYTYAPSQAIASLEKYISELIKDKPGEPLLIVGSSLGGYYAQYLARKFKGARVAMINPALGPVDTLEKFLGENRNFYTGESYILEPVHLEQLKGLDVSQPCKDAIETLILIDKEDEVIDYLFSVDKYKRCARIILYEAGDHQFQHMPEALIELEKFYYEK